MLATFIALYAAHILADFVLQPDRLMQIKRTPLGMAVHLGIVLLTIIFIAGTLHPWVLLLIGATHLAFDIWKQLHPKGHTFVPFIVDQGGHLLIVLLAAALFPRLVEDGFWGAGPGASALASLSLNGGHYLSILLLGGGFVLAVRAGGFAVASLFSSLEYNSPAQDEGLPGGGQTIGYLERSLVYFLVLTNQLPTIGFLIAAKSFLRFGAVQERKASEYVIIGTLASFGWAFAVAWGVRELSLR